MNLALVIIAALALACLVVASIIVALLRQLVRPSRPGTPAPSADETASVEVLDRLARVTTPVPVPPASTPPPAVSRAQADAFATLAALADSGPPGRMTGMPDPLQPEGHPSLADGYSGQMPAVYPAESTGIGRGQPLSPGSVPPLMTPTPSLGRMAVFATEDAGGAPYNGRRMSEQTRAYAERIVIEYDPVFETVSLRFNDCTVRTRDEVTQAFRVLLAKLRTLLARVHREHAALLVDIAGLEVAPAMQPDWGRALRGILAATCPRTRQGRFLIASYDSRLTAASGGWGALQRIHSASPADIESLQGIVLSSRDEAAALIARQRELDASPAIE